MYRLLIYLFYLINMFDIEWQKEKFEERVSVMYLNFEEGNIDDELRYYAQVLRNFVLFLKNSIIMSLM